MKIEELLALNAELDELPLTADPERRVTLSSTILSYLPPTIEPEQRAVYLCHRGDGLLALARRIGSGELVEQGLAAYEEAAKICEANGQQRSRALILNNLAALHIIRGGGGDFEGAVGLCDQALAVLRVKTDLEAWALTQINRATALARLADERVDDDQDAAIAAFEQVLDQVGRDLLPEAWARAHHGLASAWLRRRGGAREDNLSQARTACRRVLKEWTHERFPQLWAQVQHNLALVESRSPTDRAQAIERAIAHARSALDVRRPERTLRGWIESSNMLASLLAERTVGQRGENLEEAIGIYRSILRVLERLEAPELRAELQTNLALALAERVHGEPGANVEEAVRLGHAACDILSEVSRPAILARAMTNLGVAYQRRRLGTPVENLDRAIAHLEPVLEMLLPERMPLEWARAASNLANCWAERPRGDRVETQERALALYRRAQKVRGQPHCAGRDWAETEQNLGTLYAVRVRGRRSDNVERAIEHAERALQIYSRNADPQRWATVTHNLASYYALRAIGHRRKNNQNALALCSAVLEVRTRDALPIEWADSMQLCAALERDVAGGNEEGLRRALAMMQRTLEVRTEDGAPVAWARSMAAIGELHAQLGDEQAAQKSLEAALRIETPDVLPRQHMKTAAQFGHLHFAAGRWLQALERYRSALSAAELLYREGILADAQTAELTELHDVPLRAAVCLARLGRAAEAVEQLERTRTRISGERLGRRGLLKRQAGAVSEGLRQVREEIESLEIALRRAEPLGQEELLGISERLRSARAQLPPLPELDLTELLTAAAPADPIAYLVPTPAGITVLLVTVPAAGDGQPSVEAYQIERLTSDRLERWLVETDGDEPFAGYIYGQFDSVAHLKECLPAILDGLGERLAAPIVARLQQLDVDRCTIVASGLLALFPLHAARFVDAGGRSRIFGEVIELTQAPSLRWMIASRHALAAAGDRLPRLVGVADPSSGKPPLPFAVAELETIAAGFAADRNETLVGVAATAEELLRVLPDATYVHLACHGHFDLEEPLDTALLLADGPWTLRAMLNRRAFAGVRLVTLSACLTAVTDSIRVPDERIDLPTVCLEAGAAGVVAALWKVDDLATFLLIESFYRELASGRTAAAALATAQRQLRSLRAGELIARAQEALASPQASPLQRVAPRLLVEVGLYTDNERPFNDPFFWAAFLYIGA